MNKTPLSRIGSLTLDSNGVISLSNRPLNLYFHKLEDEGIPSGIPRQRTYGSVEPYLSDFLSFHDNKIRFQPNAIHSQEDAEMQIAALTGMRATMHRFIRTEYRDGPFFLTLTDMHRSNIFVDEQWNIQAVIDLEWACSQPVEMQLPPYWLTSRSVDDFTDPESIAELDGLLKEYFDIYAEEELAQNGPSTIRLSCGTSGSREVSGISRRLRSRRACIFYLVSMYNLYSTRSIAKSRSSTKCSGGIGGWMSKMWWKGS